MATINFFTGSKIPKLKKSLILFIALSSLFLILLLLIIGLTMPLKQPVLSNTLITLSAWSSTFALIIVRKRLYPESGIIEFVKSRFTDRIATGQILLIIVIQLFLFLATALFFLRTGSTEALLTAAGPGSVGLLFLTHLIKGPLGEELGWRGFMQVELEKRISGLKSALIVGCFWGLWHFPLWFLTSGYSGLRLLVYAVAFVLGTMSVSVIIACHYRRCRNLLIPVLIHQLFNYLNFSGFISADLFPVFLMTIAGYLVYALILVIVNPGKRLYG